MWLNCNPVEVDRKAVIKEAINLFSEENNKHYEE